MADQRAYIVAMTFGIGEGCRLLVQAAMAVNPAQAAAMCVSAAHVHAGITEMSSGIAVEELTTEFIEAARRGTAAPAPVVSLVQTMPAGWSPQGSLGEEQPMPPPS